MSLALSLIVSTKGARQQQFARLLGSLERQSCQDFEVIVVEQNPRSLIKPVSERRWSFPIQHLLTPLEQGVSRGRNRGIEDAHAEILVFPDDDCWYPPDFVERGLGTMHEKNLDALTGRPTDENGETIDGRFEAAPQWITRANVWTTQIEWLAFWRRDLLLELGGYDELIGVGAPSPWQSAEGQDLMLRALKMDARCWYDPSLTAHDAGVDLRRADAATIARARAYGRGMGYVLRKERLGTLTSAYLLSRAIGGSVVAAVQGKLRLALYHAATALGRFEGLIGRCFERS